VGQGGRKHKLGLRNESATDGSKRKRGGGVFETRFSTTAGDEGGNAVL